MTKDKKEQVKVSIPNHLIKRVDEYCDNNHTNKSFTVSQALDEFFNKQDKKETHNDTQDLKNLCKAIILSTTKDMYLKNFENWAENYFRRNKSFFELTIPENEKTYFTFDDWFSDNIHYFTLIYLCDNSFINKNQLKSVLTGIKFRLPDDKYDSELQDEVNKNFGVVFE